MKLGPLEWKLLHPPSIESREASKILSRFTEVKERVRWRKVYEDLVDDSWRSCRCDYAAEAYGLKFLKVLISESMR